MRDQNLKIPYFEDFRPPENPNLLILVYQIISKHIRRIMETCLNYYFYEYENLEQFGDNLNPQKPKNTLKNEEIHRIA